MNGQMMSHRSTTIRQTIIRYRWSLPLWLIVLTFLFAMYGLNSGLPSSVPANSRTQATFVEPAAQSVLDYLRVHNSVPPLPAPAVPIEPAQQSVTDYIRMHERVEQSSAPWEPAVQAVLNYLRAHSR